MTVLPVFPKVARRQDHERERLRLLRDRWDQEREGQLRKDRTDDALRPLYALLMGHSVRGLYRHEAGDRKPVPPEVAAFFAATAQKRSGTPAPAKAGHPAYSG